jgi:hypothetical protein
MSAIGRIGVLFVLPLVCLLGCMDTRLPTRLLIPKGYVGPVKIEYGVRGALPLTIRYGHYIIKVTTDGRVQTSSPLDTGTASEDEYFYYTDLTLERLYTASDSCPIGTTPPEPMIWGGGVGVGTNTSTYEWYFIGTRKQYEEYGAEHAGESE